MPQEFKASPELDWFFKRIGALRDFANAKSAELPDNEPLAAVASELSRLYKGDPINANPL